MIAVLRVDICDCCGETAPLERIQLSRNLPVTITKVFWFCALCQKWPRRWDRKFDMTTATSRYET